jgi:methylmalonyl-CoA mutase C-terminal domain/subunit
MTLFPQIMQLAKEKGLGDVLFLAGGIIPDDDRPALEEMGVVGVFGPGASTDEIVGFITEHVERG